MTLHTHSSSLVSINGFYTCTKCFQQVAHPWLSEKEGSPSVKLWKWIVGIPFLRLPMKARR